LGPPRTRAVRQSPTGGWSRGGRRRTAKIRARGILVSQIKSPSRGTGAGSLMLLTYSFDRRGSGIQPANEKPRPKEPGLRLRHSSNTGYSGRRIGRSQSGNLLDGALECVEPAIGDINHFRKNIGADCRKLTAVTHDGDDAGQCSRPRADILQVADQSASARCSSMSSGPSFAALYAARWCSITA
jgi:hypothetical protein